MFLGQARVPDGMRLYAIGDVHGRADLLERMFSAIKADRAALPPADTRIVMLGDYTDRGPDSRGVIDMLAARMDDPSLVCLRGNHDDWLATYLTDPEQVGDHFLRWGGVETLRSYGVTSTWRSHTELSRELQERIPLAHRNFLARLGLSHVEGDYFFVHAGVRPGVSLDRQARHDLIWIRDEFHHHKGSYGKVIVHGHTPHDEVEVRPNRINVDTFAYASGRLSAVVLEGQGHRFISVSAH